MLSQAPHLRVPLADGTLVATPDVPDADMIPSLLALSDVMGTGWFAADAANVKPGATVVVVGDGAVGLLGVLSAKPAEWFTGTVRIEPLVDAPLPARVNGASVTFEPGARTAWHTHPLGQMLIVTSGVGRAQRWGGPIEEIRPGDVIWIPPGEKHWHGAAPTTAMTHTAIQEKLDGKPVDWLEHVTAEQYEGR